MFDIGFGELLVCAIVALLVLGPERLPSAARTVGRWVGRARHTVNQFTEQIDREIRADELKRRIEEEVKKVGVSDMNRQVDDVTRQVAEAMRAPLPLIGADHLRDPGNTIAPPATAAPDIAPAHTDDALPQSALPHAAMPDTDADVAPTDSAAAEAVATTPPADKPQ